MSDPLKPSARDTWATEPRREVRSSDTMPSRPAQPDASGRDVFPAMSAGADDAAVSREDEANMRRALGMLGGSPRAGQPAGSVERRGASYPASGHSAAHPSGQMSPRRHRFVQDGEVPVTVVRGRGEHAPELSRATQPSPVNRVDALQESLAAEQAARGAAERALEEAQASIRTLQTRLSHLELARDEAMVQTQQFQAQAEAAATALAAADAERQANPAPPVAPVTARVERTKRAKQQQVEPEAEPEPIKWWLSSAATPKVPGKRRQRTALALD